MHAVILAAGEGSRMGEQTEDVPKAFLEIEGRTLYDRQREAIDQLVDGVTVVLGYRHERVVDRLGSADAVIVDEWREYDNAESLRRGIAGVEDDVLVLNGDVVVAGEAVESVVGSHERRGGQSVVACLPGVQSEHTAIRVADDGRVVEYGRITGHRHAGLGVLDRSHLEAARRHLRHHRDAWYPTVYPEIDTRAVTIPAHSHVEINRPWDRLGAKRWFRWRRPPSAT